MSEPLIPPNIVNTYLRQDVKGFNLLVELALNLNWSWNHATDKIWQKLDATFWERTQNPWIVLQMVSKEKVESLLADPTFNKTIKDLVEANREKAKAPGWFQKNHPKSPLTGIVYFSMEYMLTEELAVSHHSGEAWQCRRRSAQSCLRPRCSSDSHRTSLPARLFPPNDRQRRGAGSSLSL